MAQSTTNTKLSSIAIKIKKYSSLVTVGEKWTEDTHTHTRLVIMGENAAMDWLAQHLICSLLSRSYHEDTSSSKK